MGLGHCLQEQSPHKYLVGKYGETIDLGTEF